MKIQLARVVNSLIESGHSLVPLTDAMAEIDHRLSTNPLGEGESRSEFDRVLIVEPLVVFYEVHQEDRVVYVMSARYVPAGPRR